MIRTTVRRITRKLSANEVTNAELDEAINTFILYDFPEELRLFTFHRTFSFYTSENIDQYYTNPNASSTDPMTDFKNLIITNNTPVYIGGYRSYMTTDETTFYSLWPQVQQKAQIGTGNGVLTNFTGTLANIPVYPRHVLFSALDATGTSQQLIDKPLVSATVGQLGIETINGNLYNPRGVVPEFPTVVIATNTINYVTGVYNITFAVAPAANEQIYVQAQPYVAARPTSVLYYNNTFVVRPSPDGAYEVKMEAYVRPTELLSASQEPELEQHWQFIAYGAGIKILQWMSDWDTVQQLSPEFERQKLLVQRRTLQQMDDERSATIFSSPSRYFPPGSWNWFRSY
jgi:hypothetical protein